MAIRAADFEVARASADIRPVMRARRHLRQHRLRRQLAAVDSKPQLAQLFFQLRHQFGMGGDQHIISDILAGETTAPAIINDCLQMFIGATPALPMRRQPFQRTG